MLCPRCETDVDARARSCRACALPLALGDEIAPGPMDRPVDIDRRRRGRGEALLAELELEHDFVPELDLDLEGDGDGDHDQILTPTHPLGGGGREAPLDPDLAPAPHPDLVPDRDLDCGSDGDVDPDPEPVLDSDPVPAFDHASSCGAVVVSRPDVDRAGSSADAVSRPCSWPRRDAARSPPRQARPGVLPAPRGLRALAWLVDAAVIAAVAAPPLLVGVWVIPGGARIGALAAPAAGLVAAMAFIYATLSHALLGATAGKRLAGLRVVGPDGRPPSLGRSAARAALAVAGAGALGLPLALALFTRGGRAPHDVALQTAVVRA